MALNPAHIETAGLLGVAGSVVAIGGAMACGAVRGKEDYNGYFSTEGTRRSVWVSTGIFVASFGVAMAGLILSGKKCK